MRRPNHRLTALNLKNTRTKHNLHKISFLKIKPKEGCMTFTECCQGQPGTSLNSVCFTTEDSGLDEGYRTILRLWRELGIRGENGENAIRHQSAKRLILDDGYSLACKVNDLLGRPTAEIFKQGESAAAKAYNRVIINRILPMAIGDLERLGYTIEQTQHGFSIGLQSSTNGIGTKLTNALDTLHAQYESTNQGYTIPLSEQ